MIHGQIKLHEDTNGIKTPAEKKKPMGSRICQEESQQEIPGIKNPLRKITARNTRHQESTEKNDSKKYQLGQESTKKTLKKKPMASRHQPRSIPAQEW